MFKKGDKVRVDNGVMVNGNNLSSITGVVDRVTKDYLWITFPNFRYVANVKNCKKIYK